MRHRPALGDGAHPTPDGSACKARVGRRAGGWVVEQLAASSGKGIPAELPARQPTQQPTSCQMPRTGAGSGLSS